MQVLMCAKQAIQRLVGSARNVGHEFATAEPAAFDTSQRRFQPHLRRHYGDPSWKDAYREWGGDITNNAALADIRPELDACAEAISTRARKVITRYVEATHLAEFVDPANTVLAQVCAFHADCVIYRVAVSARDPKLAQMIAEAVSPLPIKIVLWADPLPTTRNFSLD